jgi:hypothetical protein
MSWDFYSSRQYTLPSNRVAHFSALLLVTTIKRFVRLVEDMEVTAGFSCAPLIVKYTTEVLTCPWQSAPVQSKWYWHTCVPARLSYSTMSRSASSSERKNNTTGTCKFMSATVCTDSSQWKYHNCSCEKRALVKVTGYRTGMWNTLEYFLKINRIHLTAQERHTGWFRRNLHYFGKW